jgi:hypothetical protein
MIKYYQMPRKKMQKDKNLFKIEFLKTLLIVLVVLISTWGITFALNNNIEDATSNFSVLGTVSDISDSTITLTDARGSDDSGNTEYEINIDYLERVETRDYEPLIITDIKVGDTISGQGLTNGSVFFIKRIISFSSLIIAEELPIEELATTTDELTEEDATTTEETIDETPATDSTSSTEEVSTSTASSSSDSIMDTVNGVISDVVDTVVDTVTDVVGGVIDLITGTTTDPVEEDQPTEPVVETPQNQSSEDSGTGQASNESSDENNVEQAESDIVSEEVIETSNEPEPVIVE